MDIDIAQLPHGPGPDAVELTDRELAALGKPAVSRTYPKYEEPAVPVHLDGQVRLAAALERRDHPDGQILFQVALHPCPHGQDPLPTRARPTVPVRHPTGRTTAASHTGVGLREHLIWWVG
ncbi:hypothetical protein [Streptomyces sp. NPDC059928]|uniref:hypothetical protein n=1 Tax=unclassified Streptomyces TaxID=2593676 RepID=UPI0036492A0D